jgi:uncharacterized protein
MQWKGRRQSGNIDDRRGGGGISPGGFGRGGGMGGPVRAGGGSLIFLIIAALVLWFGFGINPMFLFGDGNYSTGQTTTASNSGPGVQNTADQTDDFVATVLADTEDVWNRRFREAGSTYAEPTLVLFENRVQSACGIAGSATGPFYCPGDRKLYIDLSFFQQLQGQLNAPGDFAQAYVIAHEVGHHVQNLTGVMEDTDRARQGMSEAEANALSVKVELQADCYAGIWAHDSGQAGYLEDGDVEEALNAASQIGDDTLQRRSGGEVVPDSFTHGTSAQRVEWFRRGFQSGDTNQCDTFGSNT